MKAVNYWNKIRNKKFIKNLVNIINPSTSYGSSFISRFDVFININIETYLIEFKKLLSNNKNILIVNEKVKKIIKEYINNQFIISDYIIIPEKNVFDEYDIIINKMKFYGNDYTFIICAGPTATVISYELSHDGFRILDLGHFFNIMNNENC